jgi:CO dehydrogenase maturation factor
MKIAISGKGGVGKTTIMALLANQFKKEGKEVLIIDADP